MDLKGQQKHTEDKDDTRQRLTVRHEAAASSISSEASSYATDEATEGSTDPSEAESHQRSDRHTDEPSETDSSETSSYDSHGAADDLGEPHVVAVDVEDNVEETAWCEPFGSAAVAALALVAAFLITVVFMTLKSLYGYDVELTANDIDEEPTLSFLRLPVEEPAIMAFSKLDEHERPHQVTSTQTLEATRALSLNMSIDIDNRTVFWIKRVQIGGDDQILPIYSVPTTRRALRMRRLRKLTKPPIIRREMPRWKLSKVSFIELKEFKKRRLNIKLVVKENTTAVEGFRQPKSTEEVSNRGSLQAHNDRTAQKLGGFVGSPNPFNTEYNSKSKRSRLRIDSVRTHSNQKRNKAVLSSAAATAAYLAWKKPPLMVNVTNSSVKSIHEGESALLAEVHSDGLPYSSKANREPIADSLNQSHHVMQTSATFSLYQNDTNAKHGAKRHRSTAEATQCSSQECQVPQELIARIANAVETDPCEDFQQHVCGGQQGRSRGLYTQMRNDAVNSLKARLDSSLVLETNHTATQKAVSLFRACTRFPKEGLALELPRIRRFLESIGMNLTGRQEQGAKDTMDNPVLPMLRLSLQYALHTFVAFRVDGLNVVNGKKVMRVVVSRTDHDWLKERATLSERDKKDFYAGVLLVYEAKPLRPEIVMLIPDIANFESEAFRKLKHQKRLTSMYTERSLVRLEHLANYAHWYGQADEWHAQLQQLSLLAYGSNDTAHASSAALELLKLITEPESWPKGRQLMCWSLIRQLVSFGRNPLLALLPESDLKSHCIQKVSEVMEPAIQGLILFKQFTSEVREQVEAVATVVLETFTKHLKDHGNTSWHLHDSVRLEALHRLATLKLDVGFPDHIREESDLEAIYSSFPEAKGTFWDAWIRYSNIVQKLKLERVSQPNVNFEAAGMTAAYSPCLNKIVIPAGVGRPPLLISKGPAAYHYATLGMIISHALFRGDCVREARGIDSMATDCKNWWTAAAQYYYLQGTRCPSTEPPSLAEDYEYIPSLNVEPELLHALAATSAAYEAFRSLPEPQMNHVFPTLNYTAEQVFFVVNCALQCCDGETYRSYASYDDHSFCEDGVSSCHLSSGCNSVAKRLPEFSAAFRCPAGSKMNPRDRCAM
ncbi:endothelin-converting enzyme homolog isoform X1 [Dermacentor albipictus]|uniref:endothelin-converting enzyme homolog isoform X1 n=1 Tax=Dermacentor albipictus TaxID=60249 RepID=UPI0031FD32FC